MCAVCVCARVLLAARRSCLGSTSRKSTLVEALLRSVTLLGKLVKLPSSHNIIAVVTRELNNLCMMIKHADNICAWCILFLSWRVGRQVLASLAHLLCNFRLVNLDVQGMLTFFERPPSSPRVGVLCRFYFFFSSCTGKTSRSECNDFRLSCVSFVAASATAVVVRLQLSSRSCKRPSR